MLPAHATLRVARPSDHLEEVARQYTDGLGFAELSRFIDHDGFDGIIVGHSRHLYHLEFTHHAGTHVGQAPTEDHLLVFYVPDPEEWSRCCESMIAAGFEPVPSYNLFWDEHGRTFEDVDGYRVVLQNEPGNVPD